MASEDHLIHQLQDLQKQLSKKQMFEGSVSSIGSLLENTYLSASTSLQKLFFSVICRVATILKTRYRSPGFWKVGLKLFEQAERLASNSSERKQLRGFISVASEQLCELEEDQPEVLASDQFRRNRGYLFEGHLTVDPEPPQPYWMAQSNMLSTASTLLAIENSEGNLDENRTLRASNLLQELLERYDDIVPEFLGDESTVRKVPPASKEAVAKLPVINLTDDMLKRLGEEAECAICKENFVRGDTMQELPCNHTFHPPCLKPWLDVHNSCPICRHELPTDDHSYESWKEREMEVEEERKGAANAVREGEYMYV